MKTINFFIILLLIIVGLYVGVGVFIWLVKVEPLFSLADAAPDSIYQSEIIYDGYPLKTRNSEEADAFLALNDMILVFPLVKFIKGDTLALIIAAGCFGFVGGLINLLKEAALDSISEKKIRLLAVPVLGFLGGIIILALSYLIPSALVEDKGSIRPSTLIFLSLFAGIYIDQFYGWLSGISNLIFKPINKQP